MVGLCASIPRQDGLEALSIKLDRREDKIIATEDIFEMARFVLKNNYFEFDSMIKQQVSGTAIGTKFAPPYECIFMDMLETEFLEKEHLKPWVWLRYIDDIFFAWTHVEDELYKFLERLNTFHINLKFTSEWSIEEIIFLNVTVKLNSNQFVTDLYCKPPDSHQYLHYNSCHLEQLKKFSVYCQRLHIKRLCSDATSLTNPLKDLRFWFCNRGYSESMVKEQLRRVENRTRMNCYVLTVV